MLDHRHGLVVLASCIGRWNRTRAYNSRQASDRERSTGHFRRRINVVGQLVLLPGYIHVRFRLE
jgi:hypothetical protein